MKTLKKTLDMDALGVKLEEGVTPEMYLLENLTTLIELANRDGLQREQQRRLARIYAKWNEVGQTVELTEPEYDLLLKAVEKATPSARSFKLANAIYDLFELE